MKHRVFTEEADEQSKQLVQSVFDDTLSTEEYRQSMTHLGKMLGHLISKKIKKVSPQSICLACTVEDADFLAQGLLIELERDLPEARISFACFWNTPSDDPHGYKDLDVSTIIKSYEEPIKGEYTLVIVKSIISGGCIVATNLTRLIGKLKPAQIYVVAPVMLDGSKKNLQKHFSKSISSKFKFINFATDTEDDRSRTIYQKYGWKDDSEKNLSVPQIVKQRRAKFASR